MATQYRIDTSGRGHQEDRVLVHVKKGGVVERLGDFAIFARRSRGVIPSSWHGEPSRSRINARLLFWSQLELRARLHGYGIRKWNQQLIIPLTCFGHRCKLFGTVEQPGEQREELVVDCRTVAADPESRFQSANVAGYWMTLLEKEPFFGYERAESAPSEREDCKVVQDIVTLRHRHPVQATQKLTASTGNVARSKPLLPGAWITGHTQVAQGFIKARTSLCRWTCIETSARQDVVKH